MGDVFYELITLIVFWFQVWVGEMGTRDLGS